MGEFVLTQLKSALGLLFGDLLLNLGTEPLNLPLATGVLALNRLIEAPAEETPLPAILHLTRFLALSRLLGMHLAVITSAPLRGALRTHTEIACLCGAPSARHTTVTLSGNDAFLAHTSGSSSCLLRDAVSSLLHDACDLRLGKTEFFKAGSVHAVEQRSLNGGHCCCCCCCLRNTRVDYKSASRGSEFQLIKFLQPLYVT